MRSNGWNTLPSPIPRLYTRLHIPFVHIHPFADGNGRLEGAYPNCPQESSMRKRVSACFWKKVLIRSRAFSISISPIPPRSLIQTEKPNWAAREAVPSGQGRAPKLMAFSPAAAISPNRWHARLTCPEAPSGHTS